MRWINVVILIVYGIIIADLVLPSHVQGTNTLVTGLSNIWGNTTNALLGQTATPPTIGSGSSGSSGG